MGVNVTADEIEKAYNDGTPPGQIIKMWVGADDDS